MMKGGSGRDAFDIRAGLAIYSTWCEPMKPWIATRLPCVFKSSHVNFYIEPIHIKIYLMTFIRSRT